MEEVIYFLLAFFPKFLCHLPYSPWDGGPILARTRSSNPSIHFCRRKNTPSRRLSGPSGSANFGGQAGTNGSLYFFQKDGNISFHIKIHIIIMIFKINHAPSPWVGSIMRSMMMSAQCLAGFGWSSRLLAPFLADLLGEQKICKRAI